MAHQTQTGNNRPTWHRPDGHVILYNLHLNGRCLSAVDHGPRLFGRVERKNELPLPPSYTRLSTKRQIKVLVLVSAGVACMSPSVFQ